MLNRITAFFPLLFTITLLKAQNRSNLNLQDVFNNNPHPVFQQVIQDPDTYRLQIIYTQIDRDRQNRPQFTHHYFHYDPQQYFNPASMVKLPLAALALEKLNRLHLKGVDKNTALQFDSSAAWHKTLLSDKTSENGKVSIAHLIKRALLISENDPYNRMYQFVGQEEINRNLHQKGYKDVRITRQFMGLTPEQNRLTNPVRFLSEKGTVLYSQPALKNSDTFDFSRQILIGKAHMDRNDQLVQAPFDFTQHNNISLGSLQQILQSILFPESVPKNQRFQLKKDDYNFLYKYLSQYPLETSYPKYDTSKFYDSYVKFFFRDTGKQVMPEQVRVFNKVGWAYGFLTDVSYIVDFKQGIEFMLSATLYVNSDEVLNDGKYDYDSVGYPFLYQLGQTIYQYETGRKKLYPSDLSRFRIDYERRDPNDKRPSLTEVDN